MTIKLKGMTWDHPRGYDPLVACSALYAEKKDVSIEWDKRSLQDFESYPVDELAQAYDLIVIDHPHVGQVVAEGCLVPLDDSERKDELSALAANAVGPSLISYMWGERQWALPVDTASQVQAFRADRLDGPLTDLDQVFQFAHRGGVLLPLQAPHALMVFYSIAANLGYACGEGGVFIAHQEGVAVYEILAKLVGLIDPINFQLDPIQALEMLARRDSPESLSPYIFGYVSYSMEGFREAPIKFSDVPAVITGAGARGAVLGGTGVAVSAYCQHHEAAIDFAYWVTGGDIQSGPYAKGGGQPSHRQAWTSEQVNQPVDDFYKGTLETLDKSYLRPRFDGYMGFQDAASRHLSNSLLAQAEPSVVIDCLCAIYTRFKGQDQ